MVLRIWDPAGDLRHVEETMSHFLDRFEAEKEYGEGTEEWTILVDVIQKPEGMVIKASLPGVAPEHIDLSVEEGALVLKAERKAEAEGEGLKYVIRERPAGKFYRALRLPETVDTAKIESAFEHGVLTVTLPLAEEKKKKHIQITVGGGKGGETSPQP